MRLSRNASPFPSRTLNQLLSRRQFVLALIFLLFGGGWVAKDIIFSRGQFQAVVVGVADGDTVTVRKEGRPQQRVRLAFIDAPEKSQPYGQRAKQVLAGKVYGKEVSVEVVDQDRYGRLVGRIWLGGTDVNLEQLAEGYAWHYRQYARKGQVESDYAYYEDAQARAKEAGLGLWQENEPTAPWDYRREQRR